MPVPESQRQVHGNIPALGHNCGQGPPQASFITAASVCATGSQTDFYSADSAF